MKKSIIIDPGIIPYDYVLDSIKNSIYNVVVFGEEKNISQIGRTTQCVCYAYSKFRKLDSFIPTSEEAKNHYNKVFSEVISDYKTLQISERCRTNFQFWQNGFHDLIFISKLVAGYLDIICSIHPSFVFFHATPHELCSWTLGKVAETMGIPVYTTISAPLPWKSMLTCGLGSSKLVSIVIANEDEQNRSFVDDYYVSNQKKYDEAIPSYEKERIEARKGNFWSWKKEISTCFKYKKLKLFTYHIYAMFRKHSLYKYYQSLTDRSLDLTNKYVVVFLHYQPERTSLPEGRFFTQQYHLINTLRMALPNDYCIYVKEHPSMFVNNMDVRYRDKSFYKDIASIPNVKLVNIGIDSFTLIDRSICIATITGTVGIQSFIRGKSVLCFGDACYVDFKHCYNINNVEDVQKAIVEMDSFDSHVISEDFHEYLHEVDKHSLSGNPKCEMGDFYDQSYRLNSGGKVMYYLLCKDKEN